MGIITLTTDFGFRDNFVGVLKGVILGIAPETTIVDLAHEIPAFDPAAAAFSLFTAKDFFPSGTVHLVVVDPGVGSDRAVLAARIDGSIFIAPDNGALSYIVEAADSCEVRELTNPDFRRSEVSRTFHGRDIMAPAAAHLLRGASFDDVGPVTEELIRLPAWHTQITEGVIHGRIVYVDRFGNLITNIPNEAVSNLSEKGVVVTAAHVRIVGLSHAYSDVKPGQWLAVPGSNGLLEIARYMNSANTPPTLTLGTGVIVEARV